MSTQDKIQKLTETLLKLSSSVALSDAIDSDSGKNAGIAASPKAISTLASVILDAAKNASEGSDGENKIYEPLLGEVKHEIGSWWFSIDGSIPSGGLPHLGHLVNRSTYGTGWTWIETNKTVVSDEEWLAYAESHNGTCPYYSYGDGSTTFRTPSYDQSFLKVLASIGNTGDFQSAGLPNIGGSVDKIQSSSGWVDESELPDSGALDMTFSTSGGAQYNGGNVAVKITLDASLSNPIYGNSDTVTPQNFGIIVGIYLIDAVTSPIGETDAAGLLNGLSTLESRTGALENGNGFNSIGKAEIVSWGMPDYSAVVTIVSNGAVAQSGTNYTAPSNGYLFVDAYAWAESVVTVKVNGATILNAGGYSSGYDSSSSITIPLSKNDKVEITGGNYTHSWSIFFAPLKGA